MTSAIQRTPSENNHCKRESKSECLLEGMKGRCRIKGAGSAYADREYCEYRYFRYSVARIADLLIEMVYICLNISCG